VAFGVAVYALSPHMIGAVTTPAAAPDPRPTTSSGTINTPVGHFLYFDRTSSSSSFVSLERFVSIAGWEPAVERRCEDPRPLFRRSIGGGCTAAIDPFFSDLNQPR
jgi:hypothetical protein